METGTETSARCRDESDRFTGRHIHLIGVGGAGMRALAAMLLQRRAIVTGSDSVSSGATQRLADRGATIHIAQRGENIPEDCEIVVYSAAIHEQNPELLVAHRRG